MPRTLQTRALDSIERHSMIRSGDRIGVAVSGGADSVALLRLLAELRARLGIQLFVLHFHHQLRGAEADEDESFVAQLAREHRFDFLADRADVAGEARREGWNLEDAGRRLRYEFFASVVSSHALNRVAVAHTANDQAETVLAHLLRGTGPAGLAGIYPVAGSIIRPLLDFGREELREYLSALNQPWREDATNLDTTRTRARIRHKLLPFLQREFEPATVMHLARVAGLAREEEMFWHALEDERFVALTSREPSGGVSLSVADLLSPIPFFPAAGGESGYPREAAVLPTLALTRRLVRRIFLELRGGRQQFTARHVEDVLHLATKSQSGARIELPGVNVERRFDRLVFLRATAGPTGKKATQDLSALEFEYTIARPGLSESAHVVVPEIRRQFTLKVIDWTSVSRETSKGRETLDLDRLRWPLILRNWRPGDSYRPHRRLRVRKLKRMLLESRVPKSDRTSWPVLTSAGSLVWALGFPIADEFAAGSGTRAGVVIVEDKL